MGEAMPRWWTRWLGRIRGERQHATISVDLAVPADVATHASEPNLRRYQRHLLRVPVLIRTQDRRMPVRALVADISEGGCMIEAEDALVVGKEVSLAFFLRRYGLCGGGGRVVRTGNSRFGVEFVKSNEALHQFLSMLRDAPPEQRKEVSKELKSVTIEIRTR
jgi:PilZ domain-containing protein